MTHSAAPNDMTHLIWRRRDRASLMRSTALQAAALAVLASPAAAQLAATARPTGGQVSAGQASISDTASKTLITQSSQNAAINWQSYNVGSGQTVQYVQPNTASMTLNRVVGADPSLIAGHILANGQIVLINQSGVVFAKGAQVDTAGLVVSTAGLTDKNFMAGHLVFDQAGHPGAAISNAGNITIRQAGLAALVAPQVANSGTITARLGRVILGGAETQSLDLYGDGLVALNVTGQVTKVSLGGKQVTALVTNSGTILAPGGTVVLSAAAADGVVTNLVEAGGKISAQSVGAQTGRVLVQGIGGGISIDGDVSATGVDAGTKGGQVVANATGAVRVGAGAAVDASGDAGGGVIAIGTTAARAIGGASVTPTLVAQSVNLVAGSHLSANARRRGAGGRIAVLSQTATTQGGDIAARGGAAGGDGGWIEVSGGKVAFGGLLDAGAAQGKAGSILIDPADLQIAGTNSNNKTISYLSALNFGLFTGDVILKADGELTVAGAVTTNPLTRTLQLEGDEGIAIDAALNAPNVAVGLKTNGAITENSAGIITAASLSASAGGTIGLTAANQISAVGSFDNTNATSLTLTGEVVTLNSDGFATTAAPTAADEITLAGITSAGNLTLDNATSLTVESGGPVSAFGGDVAISIAGTTGVGNAATPNGLTVQDNITGDNVNLQTTSTVARTGLGTPFAGTVFSQTAGTIAAVGSITGSTPVGGTITISAAMGALSIGGEIFTRAPILQGVPPVPPGAVTLTALAGNIVEQTGSSNAGTGSILTGILTGSTHNNGTGTGAPAGDANFAIASGNTISTLTGFTSTGTFALENDSQLVVDTLQAGTTIAINGPTNSANDTGILVLTGATSAGGNISLLNPLGIAELTGASVSSTNGSVGLSTGGAIAQQTGSSLTGGEPSTVGRGISLTAAGSTDFNTYLATPALGTVSGLSLGGTVTAGALTAGGYSGSATLTASDGDILEPTGSIRTGTLTGSASGSGTSGILPNGDVLLSVSSGNSISSIGSFSATGSLVVESDAGLAIGTLTAGPTISILGPAGNVFPTGVLTLVGPITAAGGISLSNATGIGLLGATVIDSTTAGISMVSRAGAIALQSGASVTGTAIALDAGGSTVFLNALGSVHGISLDGVLTAGSLTAGTYSGTTSLIAAAGDITEGTGGSILTGILSGTATAGTGSTGSATLSAGTGNTVGTLNAFSTAGSFTLEDDAGLTVENLNAGTGITITGPANPTGDLLLTGAITAGGAAVFSNALGVAELVGASVTDPTGGITLNSAGGAVVQQAGATESGAVASLSGASVSLLAGGSTTFGTNTGIGTVAGVSFGGAITGGTLSGGQYSGSATFSATHGDIVEGNAATLLAGTVSAQASGGLQLDVTNGNVIGTISGFANGGNIVLEDDSGLAIGNLSASGSLSVLEPSGVAQTGVLIVAGTVTATGSISLANSLGIGELTNASISSTTSTISLTTAGAISQQGSSSITADTTPGTETATGTLLVLSAGGSTNFDTYVPADALGTVHGISFAGTLTSGTLAGGLYSGVLDLTASAGDILEAATGSFGAGALAGGATAGGTALGSAAFLSASGNVLGTLSNFPVTGNFALEDNAGLLVLGQTSGGSIDIHGPTDGTAPTGIVILDGTIQAPGNINLSNALGVADLAGTTITSTSGGVTLASAGGAVFEQAGAAITSGATTGTTTAIALLSGGSTDFGNSTLTAAIGTIHGLEFDGAVTAGTLSGGAYTGSASFGATHGDIVEGSGASLLVGSLSVNASGSGTQSSVPAGNVTLDITSGNSIAAIRGSSATGTVAIEDDTGLALGALSVGGSIFVHDPAAGPTGILVIGGAVSAGSSITLSNALGIAELPAGSVTSTNAVVSLDSSGGAILQQAGGSLAGGTASGSGTLLVLTAGGSTTFGNYGVTAPTTPVSGISFAGILSAGQLASGLYSGIASLTASVGNIAEGGTGSVRAATLAGSATGSGSIAGDALFTASTGNVVSTLSAFGVSGNFALEDDAGLTVLGQTSGGSIDIHGPTSGGAQTGILVIDGAITAPGQITLDNDLGIAELGGASVTSTGAGITVTSGHGAFAQQTLSSLSASGPLSITANGATDFATLLPASGLGSISGISFGGTLSAGPTGIATLSTTSGNITEGTNGSLVAGTLNGSTTGTALLDVSAGNSITAIGSFSGTGDVVLEDDAGLTIGTLTAGGLVNVHGPSTGLPTGILTLTGSISGSAVSLSDGRGISLGGTLTAGSLSGSVYTGLATLVADSGAIVETTGGVVRAGTLSGNAGGAALFDVTSGNVVSTFTSFTAGGNLTLEDDIGPVVGVLSAGGDIDIFGPGTGTPSGILQITGQSTATGNISLSNRLGILEDAGASLGTTNGGITLTSSDGAIAQVAGGTLAGGTALTLDAGGGTNFNTYVQLPSALDVQGISFAGKMTAGSLSGTLYSGIARFTASSGNIVELPTGVVQAGTLSATALSGTPSIAGSILLASVSSATTGNQVASLGASTADAGFSFVDGQALSVTGAVQDGSTALVQTGLQIVAPAINVTSGSLQLAPPGGVLPGVIDLVADHFTFGTPRAVSTPGGVVALDLLNAAGAGTIFSVGTAPTDTVSAASLGNIHSQHGTLAIGSLDGTLASPENTGTGSWTLGAGGTVTAIDFSAPVNLGSAASPEALGLFSDNVINVSNGVTVASLYGSAGGALATTGSASFLGSNAIGTLGVLNDAGQLVGFLTQRAGAAGSALQFQLADASSLLVLGPVSAGQGAIKIGVSGSASNSLTIGGTITAGTNTIIGGQITGTDIALAATGKISQLTGTLDALGATGATNGTIAIASSGGAVTLDSIVTSGTIGSKLSALLLEAGGGDITEGTLAVLSAGTLAALASGNIVLGGNANNFATVGPLASVADSITLSGLAASGTGGILLHDMESLLIADQSSVAATAGSITIAVATGSLTLGTNSGATVDALGPIALTAPGAINQNGGTVSSTGAGVTLTSQTGSIAQNGGTIAAGGGDASITAPAGIFQTGASITASHDALLTSDAGSFTQISSTILGTHGVVLDIFGAISSTGLGTIASAGIASDSTSGTVVIASADGGITFDGTIEGAGDYDVFHFFTPNVASAVLLSAKAGDITEAATGVVNAGTLAAFASGNIDLPGNNGIANIGSLSTAAPSLTLTGLFAGGTAGIALTDGLSLNILGDSTAPVIQATSSGATLGIDETQAMPTSGVNTSYGTLSFGAFGASTVLADGAITLQSTGSIAQGAGLVRSDHGALSLTTNVGNVSQAGGTLAAPNGDVTINAGAAFTQSGAVLTSGGAIGITTDDVSQSAGSTISAAGDVGIQASDSLTQSLSTITGTHGVSLNVGSDGSGTFISVQGTIASAGIAGDATSGTVAIASTGSMTIASLISAGPSGAVLLSSQGDITQVSPDGSLIGTIIAPALAAAAGGNLTLPGANQVGTIAAFAPLTGLSAGTGNIDFADTVNLTLAPGASLTALAGTIVVDVTGAATPTLLSNGATLQAAGDITLLAGGALTQTGGLFQSTQGDVTLAAASFTQTAGASLLAAGNTSITGSVGGIAQSAGNLISAGQTISLAGNTDISIAGTLQAGTLAAGLYSGALGISAGGNILAGTGTLLTGTLAAFAGTGNIDLAGPANQIGVIGTVGTLSGLQGGTITVQDAQSLVVAANVTGSAISFTIPAASFTELPGIAIASTPGPLSVGAGGSILIGGALSGAVTTLSAGTALTEQAGATITAAANAVLSAGTSLTIDGALTAANGASLSAGTDILEGQGASIQTTSSGGLALPLTMSAAGTVTLDGLVNAAGLFTVTSGTFVEDSTASVTAASTSISATTGSATIDGVLDVNNALALTADTDVTLGQTGTISAGSATIAAVNDAATLDGATTIVGALGLTAGTDVTLAQTGTINAGTATITATAGTATINGTLLASGTIGLLAGADFVEGTTGLIGGPGIGITASAGNATVAGQIQSTAGVTLAAGGDVTETAGASIVGGQPGASVTAGGNLSIDGAVTDPGSLMLSAGNALTIGSTGAVAGGVTSLVATLGAITLDGPLTATGGLTVSAGTAILADSTIDSSTFFNGSAIFTAGTDFTLAQTGTITAGATTITAATGNVTIDGVLNASGPLAGTGVAIAATAGEVTVGGSIRSSGGFAIAAGTDFTEEAGATITGDEGAVANAQAPLAIPSTGGTITAGGNATIDGILADPVALSLSAGNALSVGTAGAVTGGSVGLVASLGAITIDGPLFATDLTANAGTDILADATITSESTTGLVAGGAITVTGTLSSPGSLTLTAGADVSIGQASFVTGGPTAITAGGFTEVDGTLKSVGALSLQTGSNFTESASGVVTGGPITLASTNGAVTIDGAFTSGVAITILADTDFSEGAGATLSGVPLSVTAKTGAATIDGLFGSFGAFTLDAGTNITQGDTSTITDTRLAAGGLTNLLAAPGTITLGGTLSASSLQIGDIVTKPSDRETKAIIWNGTVVRTGSNASIQGATKSISIPAPLTPGHGALGVYLDTASFQQTGTSTVSAITGNAATMQVTVEGHGNATFNSLIAPDAQLLLVLEQGGTAGGLIDVAGLNIYYTTGIIPIAPVSLHGSVGGLGGFAAATVGFSHHLPNVDYQINSCPIQSINCILLSPLLVPIVDPVNDYAEGTQRKRHQDDDALPNVGEEDY